MIKFETKQLTLEQRIDVNDIETEINPKSKTITVKDLFKQRIKYLKYGLKKLGDAEIDEKNFDELVNKLSNDEIEIISNKIAEETNLTKKK